MAIKCIAQAWTWTLRTICWRRKASQTASTSFLSMLLTTTCSQNFKALNMLHSKFLVFLDTCISAHPISLVPRSNSSSYQGKIAGGLEDVLWPEVSTERATPQTSLRLRTYSSNTKAKPKYKSPLTCRYADRYLYCGAWNQTWSGHLLWSSTRILKTRELQQKCTSKKQ